MLKWQSVESVLYQKRQKRSPAHQSTEQIQNFKWKMRGKLLPISNMSRYTFCAGSVFYRRLLRSKELRSSEQDIFHDTSARHQPTILINSYMVLCWAETKMSFIKITRKLNEFSVYSLVSNPIETAQVHLCGCGDVFYTESREKSAWTQLSFGNTWLLNMKATEERFASVNLFATVRFIVPSSRGINFHLCNGSNWVKCIKCVAHNEK